MAVPRVSQQFGNTVVSNGGLSFQGTVNGDVHLNGRLATPPNPTAIIPFDRDTDFVQRGTILDQVYNLYTEAASRVALVGLGGVGKSQIAIEYAYQVRERRPDTWVFWVHASNAARYEQSFRVIADLIKLPGRQDPQNNIFQLVSNWLQSGKSGRWAVILDNVDQASFLLYAPQAHQDERPLVSYLPYCPHGSILITSRSRDVALQLVEARNIVSVEPMSQADAVNLIKKKLRKYDTPKDVESVEALAKALEYMPLAIVQATSYIQQRAPRFSLGKYLEKFEQSDKRKTSLLDFEGGQLRRDRDAKNSIILTWQISFNYIRETRSSAADLLSLMSFCDRQGIPERLLRRLGDGRGEESVEVEEKSGQGSDDHELSTEDESSSNDSISISSGDEEFERDITALRNFAFIEINEEGTLFEMHRLVQLAIQKWLEEQGQHEKWQEEFVRCICTELPTGEYESWAEWQTLLPQAKSAAAQRPKTNKASLRNWATILYNMSWYLWRMGRGDEALNVAEDAMKVRIKLFGREDYLSLGAILMVSRIYDLQGKWKEAEELKVEVMETSKKKLGLDHPSTLTSIANLASTYSNQGRWEAAEELELEVMETSKKKLGLDHPSTLTSMGNLASTYRNQGRWEAAEELELGVMETRKKKLGLDHPSTLTSMANLASTYRNQGRWEAAEELELEVMETSKKKLGLDHPDTLTSKNNLAFTKHGLGQYTVAISMMKSCLQARTRILGSQHPHTISSATTLSQWEADLVNAPSDISRLD